MKAILVFTVFIGWLLFGIATITHYPYEKGYKTLTEK